MAGIALDAEGAQQKGRESFADLEERLSSAGVTLETTYALLDHLDVTGMPLACTEAALRRSRRKQQG